MNIIFVTSTSSLVEICACVSWETNLHQSNRYRLRNTASTRSQRHRQTRLWHNSHPITECYRHICVWWFQLPLIVELLILPLSFSLCHLFLFHQFYQISSISNWVPTTIHQWNSASLNWWAAHGEQSDIPKTLLCSSETIAEMCCSMQVHCMASIEFKSKSTTRSIPPRK